MVKIPSVPKGYWTAINLYCIIKKYYITTYDIIKTLFNKETDIGAAGIF